MSVVSLDRGGISVQGKKTVLLCASLFYFRIPPEEWSDRAEKLKASGYNCADVYFPWNFHETEPGTWDFSGGRDVGRFLKILEENGLFVIARPGPYICSEWDGGGIPAWVLTDRSLRIRQNDPAYLAHVRSWYEKILPVIAAHQADRGGSVLMMQVENELDFYDCADPHGYMAALREMAVGLGITVPVFGCAGQSNVRAATGRADGVETAFNFYGDSCDPAYDEKFHYYYEQMREADRPLLVTETNCDHLFLRRELAAGAKLLGAYCQVGGTNFGLTGGVNNWGEGENPVSFITTQYTNDNIIGPAGEIRKPYYEGRMLAGLIHTFGPALGGAESSVCDSEMVRCDFPTGTRIFRIDLNGGGSLVCVPNLGTESGIAELDCSGRPFRAAVSAHSAPFFPFGVPLSLFGHAGGTLVRANGEPENYLEKDGSLTLTFWTESETPFAEIRLGGESAVLTPDSPAFRNVRAVFAGQRALRRIPLAGTGVPSVPRIPADIPEPACAVQTAHNPFSGLPFSFGPLQPLERYGVYRGAGCYRFHAEGEGILLFGGSDLLAVYRNGRFEGACAPAGGTCRHSGNGWYEIPVILWGHSNFADARMPALMEDSPRGLTGAVDVFSVQKPESNWFFQLAGGEPPLTLSVPAQSPETVLPIHAWNSTRSPLRAVYRKKWLLRAGCDRFVLEMRGLKADAVLYVDGKKAGRFNRRDPFLDFSEWAAGKTSVELALFFTKQSWDDPVGTPFLYSGKGISECRFAAAPEETLISASTGGCPDAAHLPVALYPGEMLRISIPGGLQGGTYLRVRGKNILAAAVAGRRILGRVLIWDDSPRMAGDAGRLYLPRACDGEELRLLAYALGENAVLGAVFAEAVHGA